MESFMTYCRDFMTYCRDFFGDPVVKTSPSNAGSTDLMSHSGARIPHALWPEKQNIKKYVL